MVKDSEDEKTIEIFKRRGLIQTQQKVDETESLNIVSDKKVISNIEKEQEPIDIGCKYVPNDEEQDRRSVKVSMLGLYSSLNQKPDTNNASDNERVETHSERNLN